jgi:hypothetical protein
MDFTVPNSLGYDMAERLTVSEVSKALLAQERLVREALSVVETIYPGLELQQVKVGVRSVAQESPYRSVLLAFVAGIYSGEIGSDMPDIIQTITQGAVDVPDNWDGLVSLLVLAILIVMGDRVRAKYWPDASEQILAREKARMLAEAEAISGIPSRKIEAAIDSKASKHPSLLENSAMDILGPAKRHHADAMSVGKKRLTKEAIAAIPSDAEMAMHEPPTQVEELEETLIQFHAHDLTRPKRWAAVVPEAFPQRLSLHLAPHLDPNELFQRREVRGDVMVTLVRNDEGGYDPKHYVLTKVESNESA